MDDILGDETVVAGDPLPHSYILNFKSSFGNEITDLTRYGDVWYKHISHSNLITFVQVQKWSVECRIAYQEVTVRK